MARYHGYDIGTDGSSFEQNIYNPPIGYTDGAMPTNNQIDIKKETDKILGYTYGYMANRGEINSPKGIHSQEMLYEMHNNWICLAVANYQKTYSSTHIYADYERTPTDRDIEGFVRRAHAKNIKVCLKPMLNCEDNVWRALIQFPDVNMDENDIYWKQWFDNYKHFILKYAELAEELKCEMLCIGCEMLGTEHRKYEWLYLIEEIRKIYSGKIVYNTNHDHEEDVEWFDALDYIGTSAYYPVGINGHTREDMIKEWKKIKVRLDSLSEKFKIENIQKLEIYKIFIEILDSSNNQEEISINEENMRDSTLLELCEESSESEKENTSIETYLTSPSIISSKPPNSDIL